MASKNTVAAALSLDAFSPLDARASFATAASLGYRGVAFGTNHAELNPEALGESARRHVKTILASRGLTIESLRAASPRGGLADSATIDRTLENARKAILLARELGVTTVSLNAGILTAPGADSATESPLVPALRELAQQADAAGIKLAIGAEGAGVLAQVLKEVDYDGARANLDGARLIGAGEDVLVASEILAGRTGQWTAADGVRSGAQMRATMLGEGQMPLPELLSILRDQGFSGPMVVDVRDLPDALAGAKHAAETLQKLLRSTQ